MRRFLLTLLVTAASAQAQVVADTLDPRGYFPLAVGNEWEYRVGIEDPADPYDPEDRSRTEYLRYRVVGAEADWFSLTEETYSEAGALLESDTASVRYDPASASVATADGAPRPFFACGLDLPLGWDGSGDRRRCYLEAVRPESPEEIGDVVGHVDLQRAKRFSGYSESFVAVHGVGFTGGGFFPDGCNLFCTTVSWSLAYAHVDGTAYGARAIATEAAPARPALRVYPNPTPAELTVEGSGPRVEVVDALGRLVMARSGLPEAAVRLDVSALPAGVYVVRRGDEAAVVTVR